MAAADRMADRLQEQRPHHANWGKPDSVAQLQASKACICLQLWAGTGAGSTADLKITMVVQRYWSCSAARRAPGGQSSAAFALVLP